MPEQIIKVGKKEAEALANLIINFKTADLTPTLPEGRSKVDLSKISLESLLAPVSMQADVRQNQGIDIPEKDAAETANIIKELIAKQVGAGGKYEQKLVPPSGKIGQFFGGSAEAKPYSTGELSQMDPGKFVEAMKAVDPKVLGEVIHGLPKPEKVLSDKQQEQIDSFKHKLASQSYMATISGLTGGKRVPTDEERQTAIQHSKAILDTVKAQFPILRGMPAEGAPMEAPAQPKDDIIRVRRKSDGMTGSVPRSEFDPGQFEEL